MITHKKKLSRPKKVRSVRPSKRDEVAMRNAINLQINEVNKLIEKEVLPILKLWKGETSIALLRDSKYIRDGFIDDIQSAFERISKDMLKMSQLRISTASQLVQRAYENSNNKFSMQAENVGATPNLKRIIKNEQLEGALKTASIQYSDLIKSVPEKYIDDVRGAIMRNYTTGEFSKTTGGLTAELRRIKGVAVNRAALIAVDQTNKLNASINQIRSEELGSISYIWRNAQDERVRGNPSGKYPDVSKNRNHWDREGKEFLWKKWNGSENNRPIGLNGKKIPDPPVEGNPAIPVRCRCHAEAVIRD